MSEEKSLVKGLGRRLRAEREAREVTLEEISRVTKISIHLLLAIENDEWDSLPGGIFTRNFIRLYAQQLGLDAERWVDEYHHFIKIKHKAEGGGETDDEPTKRTQTELPKGWLAALAVFTVVLLVGGYFLITYIRSTSSDPSSTPAEPANQPAQTTNAETAGEENTPRDVILTDEKEWEGLTVELRETQRPRCWMQWWADGEAQSPPEGESLNQGVTRSLKAEESIRLNIAHLQGVEIAVNGRAISWESLNPQPRANDEGTIISYLVVINQNTLESQR